MDASKFLVDFFKGLSPEIKLDLFNASIELLRASITPQPETASPGGIVGTPNTQRDFVLNTPEKIKEELGKHPIIREMENYLSVATQPEPPETHLYEPEPSEGEIFHLVTTVNSFYFGYPASESNKNMYKLGVLFADEYNTIHRRNYLIAETFIRRYLRRRGQGKYMPAGNNFTIAYNHNSRRYGVFPASPASQNTLPWLYAQNRDRRTRREPCRWGTWADGSSAGRDGY
jgi:hypothetical protein